MTCPVCSTPSVLLTTYKSLWHECPACGCASREQRLRYPLEWLARALKPIATSPRTQFAVSILGRKPGADVYRQYAAAIDGFLRTGNRAPCWAGEYAKLKAKIPMRGRLLDISGEPGFFGVDAKADGLEPTVTAFADNVPEAIRRLGVDSFEFDHNRHSLRGGPFDTILSRYNIGFCLDVPKFFREVRNELAPGGTFIVQHSPYTKAIPVRWMFDDYTYLRAFSTEYLKAEAEKVGLKFVARFDEGRYRYNEGTGVWWPALLAATLYRAFHPKLRSSERDEYQENETLVFR
jgi:SAM-dependent methyltransferase